MTNKLRVDDFDDYQRLAGITANPKLDPKMNLAVLSLGIAGEAGEVADYVKKHLGHDHDLDREKLKKELGDVLWYISTLASANDLSLQDVAQTNINKLAARYPDGFNTEHSKNRKANDT